MAERLSWEWTKAVWQSIPDVGIEGQIDPKHHAPVPCPVFRLLAVDHLP